jgi:protein-L-isoaspartate(D-aspartate) O-methyltransferase
MKTAALDFGTLRLEMIRGQLAERGIRDDRVLEAMLTVPRERFVPDDLQNAAYDDRALSVGMGQTISQPYIVTYMTQELQIDGRHRVLEIGTGTGYQTAILAGLSRSVHTVERLVSLLRQAKRRLDDMGVANVSYRCGDGSLGWSDGAPFDRIMITAGAPSVVSACVDQLGDGGLLIQPVGEESSQRLVLVRRSGRTFTEHPLIGVRFVKLLGQDGFPID